MYMDGKGWIDHCVDYLIACNHENMMDHIIHSQRSNGLKWALAKSASSPRPMKYLRLECGIVYAILYFNGLLLVSAIHEESLQKNQCQLARIWTDQTNYMYIFTQDSCMCMCPLYKLPLRWHSIEWNQMFALIIYYWKRMVCNDWNLQSMSISLSTLTCNVSSREQCPY